MSEIRLIDKTFRELEIDGVGYFGLPRKVYDAIEQLQKENEKLNNILTEFEKWLKEEKKKENWEYGDMYFGEFCDMALNKLQELKEGNNEK